MLPYFLGPKAANNSSISIFSPALIYFLLLIFINICFSFVPEGWFTRTAQQRCLELVEQDAPSVQIFGDSVADGGINEKVLAESLGVETAVLVNHSIPGTTAYCAYPLLKRQINAGKVPKAVILAYNCRSYTIPLVHKFLGRFSTWEELWEAQFLGLSFEEGLHCAVSRLSLIWRYREELNAIARSGQGWEFFNPSITAVENRVSRLLRLPESRPLVTSRKQIREFNPAFHRMQFRRNELIDCSLKAFFELCHLNGVQVFFVNMPKPIMAARVHAENGFDSSYYAYLDGLVERGDAKWLLREQLELPASSFLDAVHLTPCAAFDFSLLLSEKMKMSGIVKRIHDKP